MDRKPKFVASKVELRIQPIPDWLKDGQANQRRQRLE